MLDSLNQVLSLFTRERTELGPGEVAELTGTPRSTVYRHLNRFRDAGFLDQDRATGLFRLGIRFAVLGELAQRSTSLQRVALPELRRLAVLVEEMTALMVLSGRSAVIVATEEISRLVRLSQIVGQPLPLHATAGGKALLAWRSQSEQRRLLSGSLRSWTVDTVVDKERVLTELARVRERGFSVNSGEALEEIASVGAPVRDFSGDVIAAITVDAPRARMTASRLLETGAAAIAAADRISSLCGYAGAEASR